MFSFCTQLGSCQEAGHRLVQRKLLAIVACILLEVRGPVHSKSQTPVAHQPLDYQSLYCDHRAVDGSTRDCELPTLHGSMLLLDLPIPRCCLFRFSFFSGAEVFAHLKSEMERIGQVTAESMESDARLSWSYKLYKILEGDTL